MSELEKWDLLVDRVTVLPHGDDPWLFEIKAHPGEDFQAPPGEPASVLVRRCADCGAVWPGGKVHRDNGCPLGAVDEVMSS